MHPYFTAPPRHPGRRQARCVAVRFFEKFEKTDGCWIWKGSLYPSGYGVFCVGTGQNAPAHRVSWVLHYGEIPEGMYVCHNCPGGDNPACVNPDHLWLGTHAQNMADMVAKGRHTSAMSPKTVLRGERIGNAVLTEGLVREIRRLKAQGVTHLEISLRLGIRIWNVHNVVQGRAWKHVT